MSSKPDKPEEYEFKDRNVVLYFHGREELLHKEVVTTYTIKDGQEVLGTLKAWKLDRYVEATPAKWHPSLPVIRSATKKNALTQLLAMLPVQDLIKHAEKADCPKTAMGWFIKYLAKERGIELPEGDD